MKTRLILTGLLLILLVAGYARPMDEVEFFDPVESIQGLIDNSGCLIVEGEIDGVYKEYIHDGASYTELWIHVDKTHGWLPGVSDRIKVLQKGKRNDSRIFRSKGRQYNSLLDWEDGTRVFLFLYERVVDFADGPTAFIPVGLYQGAYVIDAQNRLQPSLKTKKEDPVVRAVLTRCTTVDALADAIRDIHMYYVPQIEWYNIFKLYDQRYGVSDNHIILTNPLKVKEKVGEIKFTMNGQVNGLYPMENGDATYLPIGTEIYGVEGYEDHSLLAVKEDSKVNEYSLYAANEVYKSTFEGLKEDPAPEDIVKIEVYDSDDSPFRNVGEKLRVYTQPEEIAEFLALLSKTEYNLQDYTYDEWTVKFLYIAYYTDNKNFAAQRLLFYDDERIYIPYKFDRILVGSAYQDVMKNVGLLNE